jgi:hypothetical protein
VVGEFQLGPAPRSAGQRPLPEQVEHPGQVLGEGEVQGAAHRPGPHDLAAVQGREHLRARAAGGAQRDGGDRAGVVLPLDGHQPAHGLGRRRRARAGDPLRDQPEQPDLGCGGQWDTVAPGSDDLQRVASWAVPSGG